jgi:branched-chain amino acid transport system substrate-binding protein
MKLAKWLIGSVVMLFCLGALLPEVGAQPPAPLRIGSTLSLSGPLAGTAMVHKVVGEIYVDELNRKGGLLGRRVEWVLRDDQSKPDLARTLYEQLVTVDKVDLLLGPYGTANILSAMGVAQRYNKVLIHHSFGIPSLAKYELQFPTIGFPVDPENMVPNLLYDAVAASATPPRTVAIVTSKFPSAHFISVGAREAAKKRGLQEVLYLEWDFGNREFGAIANRIKDVRPDLIWAGVLGVEGILLLEAMQKIDYEPPLHFHLFPAPGPTAKSPATRNALSVTTFEEHPPFTNNPVAQEFVRQFRERAGKAGLVYQSVDLQAAISHAAWQVLEHAVSGAGSVNDKSIGEWLKRNHVDTIMGRLQWDGPNNFFKPGTHLYKVKQVQDGNWTVVWPAEYAKPGAKLVTRVR